MDSLFSQFQSRYPMGSLISELLQMHEGQFIVRAVVQVGGVTLATGLAAATPIEQAEDQARLRALAVLGIHPPTYESQAQLAQLMGRDEAAQPQARLNPATTSTALTPGLPTLSQDWTTEPSPEQAGELDLLTTAFPEPKLEPKLGIKGMGQESMPPGFTPEPQRRGSRTGSRSVSPAAPTPSSRDPDLLDFTTAPEPIDLSDIIAQTSVELKRLGWSEAKGRNYLQRTYGKRSRQQLTDEELLDFLHYLQAESAPDEPSF